MLLLFMLLSFMNSHHDGNRNGNHGYDDGYNDDLAGGRETKSSGFRLDFETVLELCCLVFQVGAMLAAAAAYHRRVERGDYLQPQEPNHIVDVDHLVGRRGNAAGAGSSLERILYVHLACSWVVGLVPIFGCFSGVPVVLLSYLVYLPAYKTRSYTGLTTYVTFQVIGVAFWTYSLVMTNNYGLLYMKTSVLQEYPVIQEYVFGVVLCTCLVNVCICAVGAWHALGALCLPPIDAATYARLTGYGGGRDHTLAVYQTEVAAAALMRGDAHRRLVALARGAQQARIGLSGLPVGARTYMSVARANVRAAAVLNRRAHILRVVQQGEVVVVLETQMFAGHYRGKITWTDPFGQEHVGWLSIRTPLQRRDGGSWGYYSDGVAFCTAACCLIIASLVLTVSLTLFVAVLVLVVSMTLFATLLSCFCSIEEVCSPNLIPSNQRLVPVDTADARGAAQPVTGRVVDWFPRYDVEELPQPAAPPPRQDRGPADRIAPVNGLAHISDHMWSAFLSQCSEVAIDALRSGELQPEEALDREVMRRAR